MSTSHTNNSGTRDVTDVADDLHHRVHDIAHSAKPLTTAFSRQCPAPHGLWLAWLPLVAFHATSEAALRFLGIHRGGATETGTIQATRPSAEIFRLIDYRPQQRKSGQCLGMDGNGND